LITDLRPPLGYNENPNLGVDHSSKDKDEQNQKLIDKVNNTSAYLTLILVSYVTIIFFSKL